MDNATNHHPFKGSEPATRLEEATCWALLRTVAVGRLAVVINDEPEIFPINYVVDHGCIVFRTAEGAKLTATLGQTVVAFETDGIDTDSGDAWSVMLKGRGVEIHDLDELVADSLLPLAPWHGSPKHRFIQIDPSQVSGRRFSVVDPQIWRNPYTLRRTSDFD